MERGMAVLSHRNMTTLTYRGKNYVQNKEAAKIFILKENDKPKKNNIHEKFQNASVTICKIEQGFKRKGR